MVQLASAELDGVFRALADPTRRAILRGLKSGDRTVSELAGPHPMSFAAVSKHIKVLESAGLVSRTKKGREMRCRLKPDPLAGAAEWIEHYREFWDTRLDSLDAVLSERGARDERAAKDR